MVVYKYTTRDISTKRVTGKMEVSSRSELTAFLRSRDQYLVDCKDVTDTQQDTYKLALRELSDLSRQLGAMISSGVSLICVISVLVQREGKPRTRSTYTGMYRKPQQGQTPPMAMESEGKASPGPMINVYRTGRNSRQIEKVAMTMALQHEKDDHIKRKIRNTMIHPIALLRVTAFVIIVVFTRIIPSSLSVSKGVESPLITKIVNGLSRVMTHYQYQLLIGILCILAFIIMLLRIKKVQYRFDKLKLNAPRISKLLCIIYMTRFAGNTCPLYASGISIINGMWIIRDMIGNEYIESQFDGIVNMVRNGTLLSQGIQKIGGFDPKLASSVYIGEESGCSETTLTSLADDFNHESEAVSQYMVPLLEPVAIITLMLIVLYVMPAVPLPIYQTCQNLASLK